MPTTEAKIGDVTSSPTVVTASTAGRTPTARPRPAAHTAVTAVVATRTRPAAATGRPGTRIPPARPPRGRPRPAAPPAVTAVVATRTRPAAATGRPVTRIPPASSHTLSGEVAEFASRNGVKPQCPNSTTFRA